MQEYKARCSQLGTLLQMSALTENQLATLAELTIKEKLTEKQAETYKQLKFKHENPELLQGAKTLLNDWYAYQKGLDREFQFIKQAQKGIMMEDVGIEFFDNFILGGVGIQKNTEQKSNDFIQGTCDINYDDFTTDIKLPWDSKTFYSKVTETVDKDYIWQGRGYSILYNKPKAYLAYILVDTPTWGCLQAHSRNIKMDVIEFESSYSHIPESERIYIVEIPITEKDESEIISGVKIARDYLKEYDSFIQSKLGKVNQL